MSGLDAEDGDGRQVQASVSPVGVTLTWLGCSRLAAFKSNQDIRYGCCAGGGAIGWSCPRFLY